jgi:hypothetical protein
MQKPSKAENFRQLKNKAFLSVAKLAMKSMRSWKSLMYNRRNKLKKAARPGKLSWLPLLLCAADIGNPGMAQAQTPYVTTESKTTTKFQIYYGPETTLDQMIGMELAANVWAEFLADDITVKLFATTTNEIPKDVLGSATAEMLVPQASYGTFLKQFEADRKSQNDFTAYQNFQNNSALYVMIDGQEYSNVDYSNPTRANAKALGLLSSGDSGFDGHIVLNKDLANLSTDSNSPLTWNYNYTNNSIPSNSIDFLSTVIHEMGHIVGFVSGVDHPNLIKAIKDNKTTGAKITDSVLDRIITPLDLYRFSSQSTNKKIPDLSVGGDPKFSFDKGKTSVANLATGGDTSLGGDGEQASHWQQGNNDIMEPYLQDGKREVISDKDLAALDLIGWNIDSAAMGLDQLGAILPDLYKQAKATAESKMANASTWILSTPPELIKPLGLDIDSASALTGSSNTSSNTSSNCSSNNGVTECTTTTTDNSQSTPDPSLKDYCNKPENYYTSECVLWRTSSWENYYQKLGLKQQWQSNAPTTSDTKSVPEPSATAGLLVLGGLLAKRLRKRLSTIREESKEVGD